MIIQLQFTDNCDMEFVDFYHLPSNCAVFSGVDQEALQQDFIVEDRDEI